MVWPCCRARRVITDVGQGRGDGRERVEAGRPAGLPGDVRGLVDRPEAFVDGHLRRRDEQPGQREGVAARSRRFGSRSPSTPAATRLVRPSRCGTRDAASAAAVRNAVLSVPPSRLAASLVARKELARSRRVDGASERSTAVTARRRSPTAARRSPGTSCRAALDASGRPARIGEQVAYLAGDAERQPEPGGDESLQCLVADRAGARRRAGSSTSCGVTGGSGASRSKSRYCNDSSTPRSPSVIV